MLKRKLQDLTSILKVYDSQLKETKKILMLKNVRANISPIKSILLEKGNQYELLNDVASNLIRGGYAKQLTLGAFNPVKNTKVIKPEETKK